MATGIVKWFNNAKGYGFIGPDGDEKDIFAHYSQVQAKGYKSLREGQRVQFDIAQGNKGPEAHNIVEIG